LQNRLMTRSAVVAAIVVANLAVGVPALAAKPRPAAKPKPAAARVQRFTAQGLVVSATASTLKVITRQLKVGTTSLPANTVVTVARPGGKNKTGNLAGYAVTLSGNATTSGTSVKLAASQEIVKANPAEVFLGVVTGSTATSLRLATHSTARGDHLGDDDSALTVDISTAVSTVDGAAAAPADGEFAVVLGERDGNTVVAATVDAYTTAPDVVAGRISSVDGTTVTLAPRGGHGRSADGRISSKPHRPHGDDSQDPSGQDPSGQDPSSQDPSDQPAATTVDLAPGGTAVPVVLNGGATTDPSALVAGENIVILGDSSSGTFTPTIAFAFNGDDRRPAGCHHHPHG